MDNLQFTQDYYLYSPKKQGVYPVQETEWNRLKKLIQNIIPQKKIYNILSSIAFGVAISSIFSIITLYTLSQLPSWILPANWAIFVSTLIIGICLLLIDSQQKQIIKITTDYILKEMTTIEEQYDKKKDNNNESDMK